MSYCRRPQGRGQVPKYGVGTAVIYGYRPNSSACYVRLVLLYSGLADQYCFRGSRPPNPQDLRPGYISYVQRDVMSSFTSRRARCIASKALFSFETTLGGRQQTHLVCVQFSCSVNAHRLCFVVPT